jgi:ABC-2 type transport system permease protein
MGIFIGQQKELLRDKAALFMSLLFPTLLVFILGTLLGNLDNPDRAVEPFRLAYVINSDEPATVQTVQAIIEQFDSAEQVEFTQLDSLADIEQPLAEGELGAVVEFKEPFAIQIHEGKDPTQNRVVRTIFEGVARLHASVTVVMTSADLTALTPADSPVRVQEQTYGVSRTMMDYYAITMIVMIFFLGSASAAASTFYQMRKDGTLRRTLASPTNRVSVYLQLLISNIPLNILQVGVVMIVSSAFLGVHYAATWQLNLLLFTMLAVAGTAFSSLFLLLGMFIKVNPTVAILPLMWVLLFLSGTFSKEIFVPGLTELMPPYLIQTAAFDLTLFGHTGQALAVLAASGALIIISTFIGNFIFSRKDVTS